MTLFFYWFDCNLGSCVCCTHLGGVGKIDIFPRTPLPVSFKRRGESCWFHHSCCFLYLYYWISIELTMGNGQGKQISKMELLPRVSRDQRCFIESWYETLKEDQSERVSKAVFKEDLLKRFVNMPSCLADALFQCMEPDTSGCLSEDGFFYLAFILLCGDDRERLEMVYSMLPYLERDGAQSWASIRKLFSMVNDSATEKTWTEEELMACLQISPNQVEDEVISWNQFSDFGSKYEDCPIVTWLFQLQQHLLQACQLRRQLTDDNTVSNARLSQQFYPTRRSSCFLQIRDASVTVVLNIYGMLSKSANKGYITKAQWMSEMQKHFTINHCSR